MLREIGKSQAYLPLAVGISKGFKNGRVHRFDENIPTAMKVDFLAKFGNVLLISSTARSLESV